MKNSGLKSIRWLVTVWGVIFAYGCGGGGSSGESEPQAGWYRPGVETSWHIQLQGTLVPVADAQLYDIDLFDTPAETIASLRASGKRVVCYFSAGTYEAWRSDAGLFPKEAIGKDLEEWEGERWLDIRHPAVRERMIARLELAVQKGCDGVDPDNVAGFSNDTGFALSAADQLNYNRFLAAEAHKRGLAIGLKNDLDQIPQLVADFDFSINEECHEYDECDKLAPFIAAGKPVFNIEYGYTKRDEIAALCADARARGFRTLVLPVTLDGSFRISCDAL